MKNKVIKKKVTLETIADSMVKLERNLSRKIDDKIDELAVSTANGFRDIEMRLSKKIDTVDIRVNAVETKLNHVEKTLNSKIDSLDAKIDDLNFYKVRDEVFFLTKRVVNVERRIGVTVDK